MWYVPSDTDPRGMNVLDVKLASTIVNDPAASDVPSVMNCPRCAPPFADQSQTTVASAEPARARTRHTAPSSRHDIVFFMRVETPVPQPWTAAARNFSLRSSAERADAVRVYAGLHEVARRFRNRARVRYPAASRAWSAVRLVEVIAMSVSVAG